MEPLPAGITIATRRNTTPRKFRTACMLAARPSRGMIVRVASAFKSRTPNFHDAWLQWRWAQTPHALRVLCNASFPYVAFCEAESGFKFSHRFVDRPGLAALFPPEYVVLTKAEAERYPAPELLANLPTDERARIEKWRPMRVGDLIFNYWG